MCLMCLMTSLMTQLCSVQPKTPGRKPFWTLGSISLFTVRYFVVLCDSIRWKVFATVFDRVIGRKLVGSVAWPFLWKSLMMLSPHVLGGVPCSRTLLNSVARGLWRAVSCWSISKVTPSGPGLDFWFEFFRTSLIYLGLMGSMLKGLNPWLSGVTFTFGIQSSLEKSVSAELE